MAKIQKETVVVTFSKLVKDTDPENRTIVPNSLIKALQEHAQTMVEEDIIVESKIQEPDQFDAWETTISLSDEDFHESIELVDAAPVEIQVSTITEVSPDGTGF